MPLHKLASHYTAQVYNDKLQPRGDPTPDTINQAIIEEWAAQLKLKNPGHSVLVTETATYSYSLPDDTPREEARQGC
jgi:hypothetical protein